MSFISDIFGAKGSTGSGSQSTTQTTLPPPSESEIRLQKTAADVADLQAGILKSVASNFPVEFDKLESEYKDLLTAQSAILNGAESPQKVLADLRTRQLELAKNTGTLTVEDQKKIQGVADRAIELATSDINRFSGQAIEGAQGQLRSRGLRTSGSRATDGQADTPILDAASRIIQEGQRQIGQVTTAVRGKQAQAELDYPFAKTGAETDILKQQQAFAESHQNFLESLRDSALTNRLRLFGAKAGLLGAPQTAAAALQATQLPRIASTSINSSRSGTGSSTQGQNLFDTLKGIGGAYQTVSSIPNIFGGSSSSSSAPVGSNDAFGTGINQGF